MNVLNDTTRRPYHPKFALLRRRQGNQCWKLYSRLTKVESQNYIHDAEP